MENGVLVLNSVAGIFSYKNMEVDPGCSPREIWCSSNVRIHSSYRPWDL